MVLLIKSIFLYSIPIIILIGLITNLFCLIIFRGKKFKNTIFSTYYTFYVIFEIIIQTTIIKFFLQETLKINFSILSNFSCKFTVFFTFVNYPIASWLLVIISIDRYLSISFPSKYLFRKKNLFQNLTCSFVIGFNLCLYIPYLFGFVQQIKLNETNQTKTYEKTCLTPRLWMDFIDLFQSTLIPFSFMIIFTSLTIKTVYYSRKSNPNNSINKSKDIKFAISSILINILFLLFNLPILIVETMKRNTNIFENLKDFYSIIYLSALFFSYFNTTITFFINYFVNSMFKKGFKELFSLKQ